MGNPTRFLLTNLLAAATIKNGTGGGAPGRSEVAPFVMDNALTQDRYQLWQCGASVNFDLDMGADQSLAVFGLFGMRSAPAGGAGITSVTINTASAAAGYGVWTARGTFAVSAGQRDAYLIITPATARYVEFAITAGTPFTLGRVWAGAIDVDLTTAGAARKYSPGSTRTLMHATQRNLPATGAPLITYVGDDFYEYVYDFKDIDDTFHNKLVQVATARDIVLIDPVDAVARQVVLKADSFVQTHQYDNPGRWVDRLEFRSLG